MTIINTDNSLTDDRLGSVTGKFLPNPRKSAFLSTCWLSN